MSIIEDICHELWNTELNYKGVSVNIFGIPRFKKYSPDSVRQALYRLEKYGYVEKTANSVQLLPQGRDYVQKKIASLKKFNPKGEISKNKNLIVMFDIPDNKKAERDWFRWHLKKFGYVMIQKSVWVGPDPLPKEFVEYVKSLDLAHCVKKFKLALPYSEKQGI